MVLDVDLFTIDNTPYFVNSKTILRQCDLLFAMAELAVAIVVRGEWFLFNKVSHYTCQCWTLISEAALMGY